MTQVTPVYLTPDDTKSLYLQRVAASIRCEEEVNRKKAFSQIAVAEATEKVIRRTEIQEVRELNKTETIISRNGQVTIRKKCFGKALEDTAPFQIKDSRIFGNMKQPEKRALCIIYVVDGREDFLVIPMSQIGGKKALEKFTQAGLSFGYGSKKEKEVREELLNTLVRISAGEDLPESPGWYRTDKGELGFAFPEDMTWERLEKNV